MRVRSSVPRKTKDLLAKSRSNLERNVTKQRISGMPYSVEGTLQFCLADVSRLLRFAAVKSFVLLLGVLTTLYVFTLLAGGWPRLARTQGPEQFEAQPCQPQLLDEVWHRGFLQIADHLASYEQSRQLLKRKFMFSCGYNIHITGERQLNPHLLESLLILKIEGDVKQRQEGVYKLKLKYRIVVADYLEITMALTHTLYVQNAHKRAVTKACDV